MDSPLSFGTPINWFVLPVGSGESRRIKTIFVSNTVTGYFE